MPQQQSYLRIKKQQTKIMDQKSQPNADINKQQMKKVRSIDNIFFKIKFLAVRFKRKQLYQISNIPSELKRSQYNKTPQKQNIKQQFFKGLKAIYLIYLSSRIICMFLIIIIQIQLFYIVNYYTMKNLFVTILIIAIIKIYIAPNVGYLCSAYCGKNSNCTGITSSDCNASCATGFLNVSGKCQIDTTKYSVIFQQAVSGNTGFNDTNVTNCGSVYNVSGLYLQLYEVLILTNKVLAPHYSMRILFFLLWVDNGWNNGNAIAARLNLTGSNNCPSGCSGSGADVYACVVNSGNSTNLNTSLCGNANQQGYGVDSGDFNDNSPIINVSIATICGSSQTNRRWGFKEAMVLIKLCDPACLYCKNGSITNCTVCGIYNSVQYLLYQTTCYTSCPSGTYNNSINTCADCDSSCATCSGGSNRNCTRCNGTNFYYSVNNSCSNTCPTGYYKDSSNSSNPICSPCNASCTSCTGSPSPCSACNTTLGFYLSGTTCVSTCPDGTFADTSNGKCSNCNNNCTLCSNSSTNCSSCATGFYYYSNSCPNSCPTGYYKDNSNSSNPICSPCNASCTSCTGSPSPCSACNTTLGFYLSGTTCVSTCPDGTFADTSNGKCSNCNNNCTLCSNSSTNCSSCATGFYYYSNSCPNSCPTGYYQDSSNSSNPICSPCNASCTSCTGSPSPCSACNTTLGFYLSGTTCVSTCPDGTFADTSNGKCSNCNNNCTLCSNSSTNCSSCATGFYYYSNSCPNSCPTGYYKNTTNTSNPLCSLCNISCTSCTGYPSPCSVCNTTINYYLYNSVCVSPCPAGTYTSTAGGDCPNCNSNCTLCSNTSTNCTACASTYLYLPLNNSCSLACPSNYYNDGTTCFICPSTCATCTGNPIPCLSCITGNYLYSGICASTCPNGYYANTSTLICTVCTTNCTICTNTPNNCTACSTGFVYLPLNNTCPPNCPSNYYIYSGTCYICQSNCSTCTGNPTPCLTCVPNYYLYNSSCSNQCPNKTYANASTWTCADCDPSCLICTGSPTNCSSCVTGYVLVAYNNTCMTSCPTSFYFVSSNNSCYACSSACYTCTGNPTPCSVCNSGNFLFMGKYCGTTCPNPYFMNKFTNNCDSCDVTCTICTNYSINCSACASGYYLYVSNFSCASTCPYGFIQDYNTRQCIDCTSASYCVGLNISMYTLTNSSIIYIDVNFTQNVNFSTFPYQNFQTINFADSYVTLSMFTLTYNITSNSSYRIILTPTGNAMIYNQPITVVTIARNQTYYGTNGSIFLDSDFNLSISINWTYVSMVSMTYTQNNFISTMSSFSSSFSTSPIFYEWEKYNFILLIFNSLQITSCLVLINTVLPKNMYEGIRVMASFIFYDVPNYEQQSTKPKYVFMELQNNFANRRRILAIKQFYFRRTGFTSYFLFDAYSQMIAITLSYISLYLCKLKAKTSESFLKLLPFLYTLFHKFHEIAILYFTLTIIFEFEYFDGLNAYRWISIIFCLVINIYYLAYHAYKYYDMMKYPRVQINKKSGRVLVQKYGNMLKYIKFQEYPEQQNYLMIKYWLRPYNYHIISYIKKFLMMLALTIFYQVGRAQIYALLTIQILEIIRFWLTWPFVKKWMNIYRLILQIILLIVFILTLQIDILVAQIYTASQNNFNTLILKYYQMGWAGLAFVILFNIGFFIWYFYDIYISCKYTNYELIINNKKQFYKAKFTDYEVVNSNQHDYQKLNMMVENGYLQPLKFENLPKLDICIENYRIWPLGNKYQISIKKICSLVMNKFAVYSKDNNNIQAKNIIEKTIQLNKNSQFGSLIKKIESIVSKQNHRSLIIKTFMQVDQSRYKSQELIKFQINNMKSQIYAVIDQTIEKQPRYSGKLLPGFPISAKIITSLQQFEQDS